MVTDPYSVLGVSRDAGADEIKSAYRKMAKRYHPDLHPDDPDAPQKMNEINEAYDMLSHPEKYRGRTAAAGNGYSGTMHGTGEDSRTYAGNGTWYTSFDGDFDFEEFFKAFSGFANAYSYSAAGGPSEEPGDPEAVIMAIRYINAGRYADAQTILGRMPQSDRNARWNYLYSLCAYGSGNLSLATDYMIRAVRLDPYNQVYSSLLSRMQAEGRTYYTRNNRRPFMLVWRFILFFFIIRIILGLFSTAMLIGMH